MRELSQCSYSGCLACRLSRQSYLGVIHYTLLLMLFGAAAFKAVHTPLLTAMLLSELASLLCLAGKMQVRLPHLRNLCCLTSYGQRMGLIMA